MQVGVVKTWPNHFFKTRSLKIKKKCESIIVSTSCWISTNILQSFCHNKNILFNLFFYLQKMEKIIPCHIMQILWDIFHLFMIFIDICTTYWRQIPLSLTVNPANHSVEVGPNLLNSICLSILVSVSSKFN